MGQRPESVIELFSEEINCVISLNFNKLLFLVRDSFKRLFA